MREAGEIDQGLDGEVGDEGCGFERGRGDGVTDEEHPGAGGVGRDEQVAEVALKELGGRLLDQCAAVVAADEALFVGQLEGCVGQAFGEASAARPESGVGEECDLTGMGEDLGDDADEALAIEERSSVGMSGGVARHAGGDPGAALHAVEAAGGDSKGAAAGVGIEGEDARDDDTGGVEELGADAGEVVEGGGELIEACGLVRDLALELLIGEEGAVELVARRLRPSGAFGGVACVLGEAGSATADPFDGLDDDAEAAGPSGREEDCQRGEGEERREGASERVSVGSLGQGLSVRACGRGGAGGAGRRAVG